MTLGLVIDLQRRGAGEGEGGGRGVLAVDLHNRQDEGLRSDSGLLKDLRK